MAILVFFPYLPCPFHLSGANALIYTLLKKCAQHSDVDLMVFRHSGSRPEDVVRVKSLVRELIVLPYAIPGQRRCLLMHRLGLPPGGRSLRRYIRTILNEKKYSLLVCASYLTTLILSGLPRPPLLALPIDAFSRLHKQLSRSATSSIERLTHLFSARLFAHYESSTFHTFRKTVLVSQQDSRFLDRLHRRLNSSAIPLGVDSDRFDQHDGSREPFSMLFTGNFQYLPNLRAALFLLTQVIPLLRKNSDRIKLFLVGKNPSRQMLAYRSTSIIIPGYVENIDRYYCHCQLFISPLFIGCGIKNKILESAAAAMPILASPKSIEGIDIGTDIIRIARNAEEFSEQALSLLSDPLLCRQLGVAARSHILKHYSWRIQGEKYSDVIKTLIVDRHCNDNQMG